MTLVVAWLDTIYNELVVAADTRISDLGRAGGARIHTDSGPKIFLIPVAAHLNQGKRILRRAYPHMGFAFSGSTLLAQSVHAMASTCLQNLSGDVGKRGPSVEDVAGLYLKCARRYVSELAAFRGSEPRMEAFIFGFCSERRAYVLCHLHTPADEMVSAMHLPRAGEAFHIGAGAADYQRLFDNWPAASPPTQWEAFEAVLAGGENPTVGGSRQYAVAGSLGVELRPALIRTPDPAVARIEVLGCDVSDLGPVGSFSIGHVVVGEYDWKNRPGWPPTTP